MFFILYSLKICILLFERKKEKEKYQNKRVKEFLFFEKISQVRRTILSHPVATRNSIKTKNKNKEIWF